MKDAFELFSLEKFVVSTITSTKFHHIQLKKLKFKFLHGHFRCMPCVLKLRINVMSVGSPRNGVVNSSHSSSPSPSSIWRASSASGMMVDENSPRLRRLSEVVGWTLEGPYSIHACDREKIRYTHFKKNCTDGYIWIIYCSVRNNQT